MKKSALISILLTLAGCAPQVVWTKPGGFIKQDYDQDSYACEKDMRQSGYFGGGIAGGIEMNQFFDKCMVAHGWVKQQRTEKSSERDAYIASLKASLRESAAAGQECADKRKSGKLKNHRESVECSNPQIQKVFEHNGFPRMDLVAQYMEKRLELAEKMDRHEITQSQGDKESQEYGARIFNGGTPQ